MSFLNDLFGTKVQAPNVMANVNPTGFSGGGLSGGFANNNYSVTPDASRTAALQGVQQTFNNQAGDIGNLRAQWSPGSSALRSSLMTALQNNRTQSLGNLRDNLAQRRVLGSSFAQNSLANADRQYQQDIEQVQAQTFLTELSAQQQLIQQQYGAARGAFQAGLDEMNLEAGIATDLTSKATSALTSAATTQAQLDMQARLQNSNNTMKNLGGIGSLIGSLGGAALAPFTGGLSLGLPALLAAGSAIPGAVGPTSVGGPSGPSPLVY